LRTLFLLGLIVFILGGCGPIAESHNKTGAEKFKQNDLAGAKQEFQKAIFWNGGNPTYHNNLGYVLYLLKEYDGADSEFEKALADHSNDELLYQIQINQALLYCDTSAFMGKPSHKDWNQKGIAILKDLLLKDPGNAELHMRLGFAYFNGANPGGGFMELDQADRLANPRQVARYSPNPVDGSVYILRQLQTFYVKIHFFKKASQIQDEISKLEAGKREEPTKPKNP
jgi:tetratricopeptide (TPR) repeat protein